MVCISSANEQLIYASDKTNGDSHVGCGIQPLPTLWQRLRYILAKIVGAAMGILSTAYPITHFYCHHMVPIPFSISAISCTQHADNKRNSCQSFILQNIDVWGNLDWLLSHEAMILGAPIVSAIWFWWVFLHPLCPFRRRVHIRLGSPFN